jgi:ubiquinone/menaquinone biosynthesis C-methylase UbiE
VSFDAVAPWYRTLETIAFGDALQRCRVACLGEIRSPQHTLIVGEGDGRFLCELLRRYPDVQVDCVDASERMLELARRRIVSEQPDRTDQVHFLHRDITAWTPPEDCYDLIVTHFFLDCFPKAELASVIKKLASAAKPDATWLLADFRVPAGGLTRFRARAWLAVMYWFFRLAARIKANELIEPTEFLEAAGFVLSRQHLLRGGILKSELWRRNPWSAFSCLSSRGWRSAPRDLTVAGAVTQERFRAPRRSNVPSPRAGCLCDLRPPVRSLAVCAARDDIRSYLVN